MIWNDSILPPGPNLEALTRHIAAEIQSAGSDFSGSTARSDGDELARSVAEFISQHSPGFRRRSESYGGQVAKDSAGASNGVVIPSDYLLIMTCRTLWAVGREEAARALLRIKGPELNIAESCADAIFADALFPCLGMHSAFIRALRPSSSLWSLNGPYWILNLRIVFSFLDAGLELIIWRILHALMKQLAVLWDVSNGKGALGIKNSHYVSANILGFPPESRRARQFSAEVIRYCEQDLKMTADGRGWRARPAVMDIDA